VFVARLGEQVAVLEATKEGGERYQQSDECGSIHTLTVVNGGSETSPARGSPKHPCAYEIARRPG
jgi:hypothetical protein